MVLPAFGKTPEIGFEMANVKTAERRLIEAKMVNPVTYTDLESCFNEAFRDLKRHSSTVGYLITLTEKAMKQAKAEVLLDKYPQFLETSGMKKSQDNADLREAFLMRDEAYMEALDRLNQLKAMESMFDGKIKVMENVCRYMRQAMQLILRSGLSSKSIY
jgi:hypothetical protein